MPVTGTTYASATACWRSSLKRVGLGNGKYSATEKGVGDAGSCGKAMGPRSFSRCRKSASRSVSPCMTRPLTSVRVMLPAGFTRSSTPTSVTAPMPSTRTGIAST